MKKGFIYYLSLGIRYLDHVKWSIIYLSYRQKYNIDKAFRFNGNDIKIYGNGTFSVLENSYIGAYSSIQIGDGLICSIGRNVRIARNVSIYTTSIEADDNLDKNPFLKENQKNKSGNVFIGNGVWIGTNVFINPGITIGDNSVIGANSVVNKNIPANSIWGGVPAKLIREKRDK